MKYRFEKVAYSSVVGQSVMVSDETGKVIAQLSIMVPNPDIQYRETAQAIADHICNSEAKRDALQFLADEGQKF